MQIQKIHYRAERQNGDIIDADFEAYQDALDYAEYEFQTEMMDDDYMFFNGQVVSEDVVIHSCVFDDNEYDGFCVVASKDDTVEYEHYHGDAVEHEYRG